MNDAKDSKNSKQQATTSLSEHSSLGSVKTAENGNVSILTMLRVERDMTRTLLLNLMPFAGYAT